MTYASESVSLFFEVFSAESLWARSIISSSEKGSMYKEIEHSFKHLAESL